MIKEIKYSGYSAKPSDYNCPDGELSGAINLLNEDGALHSVMPPVGILDLEYREKVLLIHHVTGQNNYVLLRPGAGDDFRLFWMPKNNDGPEYTLDASEIALSGGARSGFQDIAALGNTLIIATSAGCEYFLWKDGGYLPLGQKPPCPAIQFSLRKVNRDYTTFESRIPGNCCPLDGVVGSQAVHKRVSTTENLHFLANTIFGDLLSHVAENVTSQGYFYQPFFIRYAIRLFDGSYILHSAPVLMLPTALPPLFKFMQATGIDGEEVYSNVKSQLLLNYFHLQYLVLESDLKALDLWSDIVTSVDVFASMPIYTYDQSGQFSDPPYAQLSSYLAYASPAPYTEKRNNLTNTGETTPEYFDGLYAEPGSTEAKVHTVAATAGNTYYWKIPKNDNFKKELTSACNFYKIASFEPSSLKAGSSFADVKLDNVDLSTLATLPTLPDDYQSHHRIHPTITHVYNSRLNLAGISIKPPVPFPWRTMVQHSNENATSSSRVSARITVWSRVNGQSTHAVNVDSGVASYMFDPSKNFPFFIYYPDSSAYRMEIEVSQNESYIIPLTPHDYLNGAYWLGAFSQARIPELTDITGASDSEPSAVPVLSKVYTSDVNNPFIFRPECITTVGSTAVLAISSAAKALSQGQFGQFPLYAFTNEGVWALEISSTGSISARQPITRDVCLVDEKTMKPEGLTQIDSAVLFPTDRGIMMLSGSQIHCLTDSINTSHPFQPLSLPHIEEVFPLPDQIDGRSLDILPFKKFLKGCRMIYDYIHQRVIAYNTSVYYAYVYSLKSQMWGMIWNGIRDNVPSYPEALAIDCLDRLVDFSQESTGKLKTLLITRPLKLDAPDVLKTIDTVIQRGHFQKGHVQSILYGSRDLYTWHLIWSSKDHYLRGFRGTPYKYFRIALVCNLQPEENLFGASLQFTPRHINQSR